MVLAAVTLSGAAFAQTTPAAPEPDYTASVNVGAVTDYRYRGISQTRLKPALQGGADFAHKSGFYVGAWASSIRWIEDTGDIAPRTNIDGPVELDLYGGYKFSVGDFGIDLGVLRYEYISNNLQDAGGGGIFKNANTTEVYAAGTWGPATLKYSYALTNLFGNYNFATNENTKGSGYLDLSGTFDLGVWGLTLTPHVGHQWVNNLDVASYTDYSLTLGKDFGNGLSVSLAGVGTDADKSFYASPVNGKFMGKSGLVAGVKYTHSF
ncbi:signal peptide protein [Ramlibacter tataouinensis]|uniref:Signal peptide protein n=2 Tax=Ramlibacter tataouinensis TaxID=94132 RepID=A0A127JTJ7_9BURK|nr:signal peptide protein [Ramlibacter tataouinensis]